MNDRDARRHRRAVRNWDYWWSCESVVLSVLFAPVVLPVKFVAWTGKAMVDVARDVHNDMREHRYDNLDRRVYKEYKKADPDNVKKEFVAMLVVLAVGLFVLYGMGFFG